jgi:Phosphoesterase family
MNRRLTPIALCAVLLVTGTIPVATGAPRRRAFVRPSGINAVRRVFVVILENEDIAPALDQPFLAEIAARGALLRNYHGLTHPSQPNYIALTAGSAYGIVSDSRVDIDVPHLGNLLEAKGYDWKVYAENYPGNCFLGAVAGDAASGQYARKHMPFLDYQNVQDDPARCARIVEAGQLDADFSADALPRFAMYVPNLRNDGHDTGTAFASRWLESRFAGYLENPAFMDGTLFVVVFDEGSDKGPNNVYCALIGTGVAPGSTSDLFYDHYDLLRTIEEIFHTGTLHHHDDPARIIDDIWKK